jgi:hypothetical protein
MVQKVNNGTATERIPAIASPLDVMKKEEFTPRPAGPRLTIQARSSISSAASLTVASSPRSTSV